MHRQQQYVIIVRKSQQPGSYQGSRRQVEGLPSLLHYDLARLLFAHFLGNAGNILNRERNDQVRCDPLHRMSVFHSEGGTLRFMSPQDFVQRTFQPYNL